MKREFDIRHCARCGQDHEALEFKPFTRPVEYKGVPIYQLWALCPINGEPILMRFESVPQDNAPVEVTSQ